MLLGRAVVHHSVVTLGTLGTLRAGRRVSERWGLWCWPQILGVELSSALLFGSAGEEGIGGRVREQSPACPRPTDSLSLSRDSQKHRLRLQKLWESRK